MGSWFDICVVNSLRKSDSPRVCCVVRAAVLSVVVAGSMDEVAETVDIEENGLGEHVEVAGGFGTG
jgi:hypothetical protein